MELLEEHITTPLLEPLPVTDSYVAGRNASFYYSDHSKLRLVMVPVFNGSSRDDVENINSFVLMNGAEKLAYLLTKPYPMEDSSEKGFWSKNDINKSDFSQYISGAYEYVKKHPNSLKREYLLFNEFVPQIQKNLMHEGYGTHNDLSPLIEELCLDYT